MFTLGISCLTTSNLPLVVDLTFQVPMQYCSLQCRILLLSPVPSNNWLLFLLRLHPFILSGVISPLISSSIMGTYRPGSSSFSVLSFCLFILFMGFSRQEYWSGLPFPSPVDHVLSEPSTMTCPSWVALHGTAHSFIELDKVCGPCPQILTVLYQQSLLLFSHIFLIPSQYIVVVPVP